MKGEMRIIVPVLGLIFCAGYAIVTYMKHRREKSSEENLNNPNYRRAMAAALLASAFFLFKVIKHLF